MAEAGELLVGVLTDSLAEDDTAAQAGHEDLLYACPTGKVVL